MKYKSSELAIIIPSINHKNINKCIDSINKQTKKPGQTIIIFDKKKKFKRKKNFVFSFTKKKNQVYQRNHGLRFLKKNIKLILQLDDKFFLHEKAIENLINDWNIVNKNVAGIGIKSNFEYQNVDKYKFLKFITLTGSSKPGKVIISGFNNKLITSRKMINVDWLQGGLSSWRLKHVPIIFNRNYPLVDWSILEDLIFSFHIKFNKNFSLKMTNSLKAYVIKNKEKEFSVHQYYCRGYEYAKMHKVFVYLNRKKLSKFAFYYSYISSSLLGIFWSIGQINKKVFFYLGRLHGIFANTKNVRVL